MLHLCLRLSILAAFKIFALFTLLAQSHWSCTAAPFKSCQIFYCVCENQKHMLPLYVFLHLSLLILVCSSEELLFQCVPRLETIDSLLKLKTFGFPSVLTVYWQIYIEYKSFCSRFCSFKTDQGCCCTTAKMTLVFSASECVCQFEVISFVTFRAFCSGCNWAVCKFLWVKKLQIFSLRLCKGKTNRLREIKTKLWIAGYMANCSFAWCSWIYFWNHMVGNSGSSCCSRDNSILCCDLWDYNRNNTGIYCCRMLRTLLSFKLNRLRGN